MENIEIYLERNKEKILDHLFDLIRIPSISSQEIHKPDMQYAAQFWESSLLNAGVDKAIVFQTAGHPVVFAEKLVSEKLPTILVYGHYDVMPVDPVEAWISNPFEPEIREERIWARGANDDKGQSFIHLVAFTYLLESGTLPCNVKFLIEGEEEVGSTHLGLFCREHKDLLHADMILVSDTSMIAPDIPSITTGLRGLAYWEVEVTGPSRDLHSGLYGGAVANPVNVLCQMIAALKDDNNRITIPGFYDDVVQYSQEERNKMAERPYNEESYMKAVQVDALHGEEGYTTIERTGIRPTFDVCGIWGGYMGEGSKTILPSRAFAKLSCRLVPGQDYQKIGKLFSDHFAALAPPSVKVNIKIHHGGNGYECPSSHPAYIAAEHACKKVYGKFPIPCRSGGSIPIVAEFEQILGLKTLLLGFGLESDAIHSPNENFRLENFLNGIKCVVAFYHAYAEQMKMTK